MWSHWCFLHRWSQSNPCDWIRKWCFSWFLLPTQQPYKWSINTNSSSPHKPGGGNSNASFKDLGRVHHKSKNPLNTHIWLYHTKSWLCESNPCQRLRKHYKHVWSLKLQKHLWFSAHTTGGEAETLEIIASITRWLWLVRTSCPKRCFLCEADYIKAIQSSDLLISLNFFSSEEVHVISTTAL